MFRNHFAAISQHFAAALPMRFTRFAMIRSYFAEINSWYLEQDLVAGFSFVKKSSRKTKIRPNGGGVNVRNCCIHSSITPFVWLSVGPN